MSAAQINPYQGLVERVRFLMEDAGSAIDGLKERQAELLDQLQAAQKTVRGRDQKIAKLVSKLDELDAHRMALEAEQENLTELLNVRQNQLTQVNSMVDKFVGQLQQEVQTLPDLPPVGPMNYPDTPVPGGYGAPGMSPVMSPPTGAAAFSPRGAGIAPRGAAPGMQALEAEMSRFGQRIGSARGNPQQRALIMAPRR